MLYYQSHPKFRSEEHHAFGLNESVIATRTKLMMRLERPEWGLAAEVPSIWQSKRSVRANYPGYQFLPRIIR